VSYGSFSVVVDETVVAASVIAQTADHNSGK